MRKHKLHDTTRENNKIRKEDVKKNKLILRLKTFLEEGECVLMYSFVRHLLDSDTFSIRLCYN